MRKWLLLVGCLLPFFGMAEEGTLKIDDVQVKGRSVFGQSVQHGYAEYAFSIVNESPAQTHEVEVVLSSTPSNTGSNCRKTVLVPPNGRVGFSMFRDRDINYLIMTATVDRRHTDETGLNGMNTRNYWFNHPVSLLASKVINQDDLQKKIEEIHSWTGTKKFEERFSIERTDLHPKEWSANWLSYSSFDGVMLKQSDIKAMNTEVLAALKHYAEVGGVITILGGKTCPFSGNTVQRINTSKTKDTYAVGFGRCFLHSQTSIGKTDGADWLNEDNKAWIHVRDALDLNENEGQTNQNFQVIDRVTIPVRSFLLLVTLFALIAGPVTVVVLAKTNRRIWLLWLIPLESALACGLVLTYSFVSEGITPNVRLQGLTLLDQEQHMATTIGWAGYYCPQRPSGGLFFADDWELLQVKEKGWGNHNFYDADWTRGQHLSLGWVQARVPSFFKCRRNTIRRERVECRRTPEGVIEVVNGLGADIKSLWLRDAEGNLHGAENIKAGEQIQLESKPFESGAENLKKLRQLFTHDFKNAKTQLRKNAKTFMIPGCYVAVLDGAPFMNHGLGDKTMHLDAEGIVYGILPKEDQP